MVCDLSITNKGGCYGSKYGETSAKVRIKLRDSLEKVLLALMIALVEQFLDHISFECGLSPKTREAYGNDLSDFSRFAQAAGIHTPREVTRNLLLG